MEYAPIIVFVGVLIVWFYFHWRWKRSMKEHSTETIYQKQFPEDYL